MRFTERSPLLARPSPPLILHLSAALILVCVGFLSGAVWLDSTLNRPTSLQAAELGTFLHMTDPHIEPFYDPRSILKAGHGGNVCRAYKSSVQDCATKRTLEPEADEFPFGRVDCDPPFGLFRSALSLLRDLNPQPDFILYTGDGGAHVLSCPDIVEVTLMNLSRTLRAFFPSTKIVVSIGNTDVFPAYHLEFPPEQQIPRIADIYRKSGLLTPVEAMAFSAGGFYSAVPVPGLRIISLNTLHFHPLRINQDGSSNTENDVPDDPGGQLAWLARELDDARTQNQKVYIIGHHPPGMKAGESNMFPKHLRTYLKIIRQHPHRVVAQFFGDHSQDDFRLVQMTDAEEEAATGNGIGPSGPTNGNGLPNHPQSGVDSDEDDEDHGFGYDEDDDDDDDRGEGSDPDLNVYGPGDHMPSDHLRGGRLCPVFISPGMTPRKSCNPAVRQFLYERTSLHLVDVHTYYLDLERVNRHAVRHGLSEGGGSAKADNISRGDGGNHQDKEAANVTADKEAGGLGSEPGSEPVDRVVRNGGGGGSSTRRNKKGWGMDVNNGTGEWRLQYSFRDMYGVPDLSGRSLKKAYNAMLDDPELLIRFLGNRNSRHVRHSHRYFCDIRYLDAEQHGRCVARSRMWEWE